ncbi:hypothetical protein GMRT_13333 [Giardia muris]|uniref:Uncharacterized protein n=1 Tax=Giardia muris TaxID=5742 RepID=A0A4Z1SRN2_GIAMU|nr:hypothetical protein GMRT_13333 [Giardia muris]|eukprot:TNJ26298.1 hypothetical protein GMRT_13333 [Giardia muris]
MGYPQNYTYRLLRLLQAVTASRGAERLLVVCHPELGPTTEPKALFSYLLEGTAGVVSFTSSTDFDGVALYLAADGTASWFFPLAEMAQKYEHIIAAYLKTRVYIGEAEILIGSGPGRKGGNPCHAYRVVGARQYTSLPEVAEGTGFASSVVALADGESAADVPLLKFIEQTVGIEQSHLLTLFGMTHSGHTGQTIATLATKCTLVPFPFSSLFPVIFHLDSHSVDALVKGVDTVFSQFSDVLTQTRRLCGDSQNLNSDPFTTLSDTLQQTFKGRREHVLEAYPGVAELPNDSFASREGHVKYYPLTIIRKPANGTSDIGGVVDLAVYHPFYPIQFRRALLLEPSESVITKATDPAITPGTVSTLFTIAGAVSSQLPTIVTLLAGELKLGQHIYSKGEDVTTTVNASLDTLKGKIAGLLLAALQADAFPVCGKALQQAVTLTANALKVSVDYYNLGLTRDMGIRGVFNASLAIQVRYPCDRDTILAITLVHGDTIVAYPGGYSVLTGGVGSDLSLLARPGASSSFTFSPIDVGSKLAPVTNLSCKMRLFAALRTAGRTLLVPVLHARHLPCMLSLENGFALHLEFPSLGAANLHLTPNQRSQHFAMIKSLYMDGARDLSKYQLSVQSAGGRRLLLLYTRLLTEAEQNDKDLACYAGNSLDDLAAVIGHSLAGEFAVSTELVSRSIKSHTTSAIRLLLADGGVSTEDAISKVAHLPQFYSADACTFCGFCQLYEPANLTAAHGIRTLEEQYGAEFEQLSPSACRISSAEDVVDVVWKLAKSVAKMAELPPVLQETKISESSREKLLVALRPEFEYIPLAGLEEMVNVVAAESETVTTTRELLKKADARAVATLDTRVTLTADACCPGCASAIHEYDYLSICAARGLQIAKKLMAVRKLPADFIDALSARQSTRQESPVSPHHKCFFGDARLRREANNHVVVIHSPSHLSVTLTSLFAGVLQAESQNRTSSISTTISRTVSEPAFLADLMLAFANITNTLVIAQVTSEAGVGFLGEVLSTLAGSSRVTTLRHIVIVPELELNVHCVGTKLNLHQCAFNDKLLADWTTHVVVLNPLESKLKPSAAQPLLSILARKKVAIDSLSVPDVTLNGKHVRVIVGPKGRETLPYPILGFALHNQQVVDICTTIFDEVLRDIQQEVVLSITPNVDLTLLASDLGLDTSREEDTFVPAQMKFSIGYQAELSSSQEMLRQGLGPLRKILATRTALVQNIIPRIFDALLDLVDGSPGILRSEMDVVVNLSNTLFIEFSTWRCTVSAGRYSLGDYAARKFYPNLNGKATVLFSDPVGVTSMPLERLFTALISEIERELVVELTPTDAKIIAKTNMAPLTIPTDKPDVKEIVSSTDYLNSLPQEEVTWPLVKEYYDDERLPPGWFYDGLRYISMDGERSTERPDRDELMQRFRIELKTKSLRGRVPVQRPKGIVDEVENEILQLNLAPDLSDSEV